MFCIFDSITKSWVSPPIWVANLTKSKGINKLALIAKKLR